MEQLGMESFYGDQILHKKTLESYAKFGQHIVHKWTHLPRCFANFNSNFQICTTMSILYHHPHLKFDCTFLQHFTNKCKFTFNCKLSLEGTLGLHDAATSPKMDINTGSRGAFVPEIKPIQKIR
jgi:hypothetical protein